MIHLGAHVSIAGGISQSIDRITNIGGNCMQIFSASPRGWNAPVISSDDMKVFREKTQTYNIGPVYFHASYLINLADAEQTGEKSKQTLITEMSLQPELGITGSVVHLGSYKKKASPNNIPSEQYETLLENMRYVLEHTPEESLLLIENVGMRKIGLTLEEIADILNRINSNRLKICLDTCHLHAAGYDLKTPDAFESFFDTFDKLIGLDRLELFHMNDSKDPFGSLRDRHENIGQGFVGTSVFTQLVNDPRTKHLPFILETPGFDGKGPDKKNIEIVKSYISHT